MIAGVLVKEADVERLLFATRRQGRGHQEGQALALGNRADARHQQLLALLGGLLGLTAGYSAVLALVQYYPSFPASPPVWAVVAAMLLSLTVGVGFGVWPARRATRLDPVSALARR